MAKIPIKISEGSIEQNNTNLIVGIDLGTTNSLVSMVQDGKPIILKDHKGKSGLTPSIIFFDTLGPVKVGEEAKDMLLRAPERTIYSSKRLMGKSYKDMTSSINNTAYQIIQGENEDALVRVKVGDQHYSPIFLSSLILKHLKQQAEKISGQTVDKAVITVPAYFNDIQRQATRDAGKLAGLEVLRIVNEPTAASLAYGIGVEDAASQNIAVYDLGGGTFDISILSLEDGVFDVLSTHGDTQLGGDDIDQLIMQYWSEKFDNVPQAKLRVLAEEAKVVLSSYETYSEEYEGSTLIITRPILEKLIEPLVNKTLEACQLAIADSGLKLNEISNVIMVGGSTRVPYLKAQVSKLFKQEVNDRINPDEVVALGAAIQADILAGNRKDILLLDVTPLSLGIETVGELMDVIIPRNTKVPHRAGRQYTTSVDGQKNLKVSVYQGERDLVHDNRHLGEFILKDIPPMPAGIPKIEIQFLLDPDGILTVKAKELRSETETQIQIQSQHGVSEEDMSRMLLESIKYAKSDLYRRSLIEAQTEAKSIINASEKFVVQNKEWLKIEQIQAILDFASLLTEKVDSGTKDEILSAMDKLNDFTRPLAEKALDINVSKHLKDHKM